MPNALELAFLVQEPPNWRAQCGSQNLTPVWKILCTQFILQFLVIGVDYIMTLFLLPISLWVLLYILSYRIFSDRV